MKLLASAAALACAVATLVAAPALSLDPLQPEPESFELAAPAPPASAAGGPLVSRRLRPRGRFNLVGLRWRGRAEPRIAVRTRRASERWTRWQALAAHADHGPDPGRGEPTVAASDPAWVGEADEIQYRTSRRLPGLRLHFENVDGTATAADRRRTAVRRAAHAAFAAAARLVGARPAEAQGAMPGFVSREAWGADACPPRGAPSVGSVKSVFVHHTVSLNGYSAAEAPRIVLAICRYHRNSNDWNDIGYQALVDRFGTLYEGRAGGLDQAVVGAQAQGYNAQSAGISIIGDHSSLPATGATLDALARYIRWKLPVHGAPTSGTVTLTSQGGSLNRYPAGTPVTVARVSGHRDVDLTACPGSAAYGQLAGLRARLGRVLPAAPAPGLAADVVPRVVNHGASARVRARLTAPGGAPLAGEMVRVEALKAARWRLAGTAGTDADGRVAAPFRGLVNRLLRVRYAGNPGLAPARSARFLLRVRAVVRLPRPPRRATRGARVAARGTVTPRKRVVWQVLELRRRGRWVRAGVKPLRVRRGRFVASFVPAGTGAYRAFAVAARDGSTERGGSRAWRVTVRARQR